jgi:hypothetical protein
MGEGEIINLIFGLIKIPILACIYASVLLFVLYIIEKKCSNLWLSNLLKKKVRLWFFCGLASFLFLTVYLFLNWSDLGLDENSRIPIGHGKYVCQMERDKSYINPQGFKEKTVLIEDFYISPDYVFAETEYELAIQKKSQILVWNLKTDEVTFLKSFENIKEFKNKNGIIEKIEFKDYYIHHRKYWNGWRMLL